MDNKEQARVKAEAEHTKAGHKGYYAMIVNEDDRFTVRFEGCLQDIKFPFADLKDGDLCICQDDEDEDALYYFEDAFYTSYQRHNNRFKLPTSNAILIKKTGFNILEHLEGDK